jgi:hypothetical protein
MVILLRRLFISMIVPFLWKRWRQRSRTPVLPADQQAVSRRGPRSGELAGGSL